MTDSIVLNNVSKIFSVNKPKGLFNTIRQMTTQKQSLVALDNVSFNVKPGEILGIIGLNGSGKSTLLRIIAGLYTPTTGTVQVNGTIAPLMQIGVGFQGDLDAKENILLYGMLLGFSKSKIQTKLDDILSYAELTEFSNMKVKQFSSGMRARLAFSTALHIKSDILLIDEVLSVGDRIFRKKSYESFLTFQKDKKTVLHATHSLARLADFSDRVLLLDKGKLVSIGEPEKIIEEYNSLKPSKK